MSNLSPTVLDEGHPDRDALTAALRQDLATSMGVDLSLVVISNIRAGRRRLQAASVAVQFDLEVVGGNEDHLARLTTSLADPGGSLLNGAVASLGLGGGIDAGQTPQTTFVCPTGKIPSTAGAYCEFCAGDNEYSDDRQTCNECPASERPNSDGDGCICKDRSYDASAGLLICYKVGADWAAADFPAERDAGVARCLPCDDNDCLVCEGGVTSIAKGFMVSEADTAIVTAAASLVGPLALFECPLEGSDENPACNGTQPDRTSMCNTGYSGPLCSVCKTGFSKSGDECVDCADASGYAPIITAAVVGLLIILVAVIMSCYSRKVEDADEKGGAAKGAASAMATTVADGSMDAGGDMVEGAGGSDLHLMVLGKILTGLFQILSEMPAALALTFPAAFTAVLDAMKVFLLEIFEVFRMDCVSPLSVHAKFIIVMLLPLVGIAVVQLLQCTANARVGRGGADAELAAERRAENKANAAYRTFFVIFLLYPLLSRTAFHMTPTSCQTLGADEQWHMDDMSIDCGSGTHVAFMALGLVCGLIYPSRSGRAENISLSLSLALCRLKTCPSLC